MTSAAIVLAVLVAVLWPQLRSARGLDPAGCVGCGGHDEVVAAVWGPDSPADEPESYCSSCYRATGTATPGFLRGCTVARVPAGLTERAWVDAACAAWPARVRVAWWLLRD